MDKQEMAMKVEELMKEGKTLVEAIELVLASVKTAPAVTVKSYANMTIIELDEAWHHSRSKLSRTKSGDAGKRYAAEIAAIKAQLEKIRVEISESKDPIGTAQKYGMSTKGLVNLFAKLECQRLSKEVQEFRDSNKLANTSISKAMSIIPPATPEAILFKLKRLGNEATNEYNRQVLDGNLLLQSVNKKVQLLQLSPETVKRF